MDWQSIQPIFLWLSDHPLWSGLFVFLIAFTESLIIVGLIVPGAVLMFGVGTLVGTGVLDVKLTLFLAFIGAVLGDGISFMLGAKYREQLENIWPFGKKPHILEAGKNYFVKHGGKSIFFGRFIGPIRPIIPAVAGMMYMPKRKFFIINIISAAGWAPFYLIPGILFGTSIELASIIGFRLAVVLVAVTLILVTLYAIIIKLMAIFPRPFLISICTIILVAGILSYRIANQPYEQKIIPASDWSEYLWKTLPEKRMSLLHDEKEMFNIQWLGDIQSIQASLLGSDWQQYDVYAIKSALYRLAEAPNINQITPFPKFNNNRLESVIFFKPHEKKNHRYVIRLWKSNAITDSGEIYWLGNISVQRLVSNDGWLSYFRHEEILSEKILRDLVADKSKKYFTNRKDVNNLVLLMYEEFDLK